MCCFPKYDYNSVDTVEKSNLFHHSTVPYSWAYWLWANIDIIWLTANQPDMIVTSSIYGSIFLVGHLIEFRSHKKVIRKMMSRGLPWGKQKYGEQTTQCGYHHKNVNQPYVLWKHLGWKALWNKWNFIVQNVPLVPFGTNNCFTILSRTFDVYWNYDTVFYHLYRPLR